MKKNKSTPKGEASNKRIKLKLGQIVNPEFKVAFTKLLHVPFQSINDSWAVSRSLTNLNVAIDEFTKVREAKIRAYGEEKDGTITVKKENEEAFFKEMSELAVKEVEIYLDHVLVISEDILDKNSRLTGADLSALEGLVMVETKDK